MKSPLLAMYWAMALWIAWYRKDKLLALWAIAGILYNLQEEDNPSAAEGGFTLVGNHNL